MYNIVSGILFLLNVEMPENMSRMIKSYFCVCGISYNEICFLSAIIYEA